ncbi:MAG: hypothetical protein AB1938_09315 [Myxococcota bacterium]
MKRLVLAVAVFSSVALAQNVPQQLALTARLSQAGQPLTGSHTLLLKLFDTPSAGSELWSESALASAESGLVSLTLGAQTPLTPAILDGRPLFVEVAVDGQVLSPRLPVVSVPYAVRASIAATSATLGNLSPTDVALASHTHQGLYLPLGAQLACTGTQKVTGLGANGSVVCGPDDTGAGVTAGAGLTQSGTQLSVSFGGSGAANTAARSDHNHSGVYLPVGAQLSCTGTQKVSGLNASTGSVVCSAETAYTAGAGLALSGTQFSVAFAGLGAATTAARSDHGHVYNCPAGYLRHWFPGPTPEGTHTLCTKAVAGNVTWPAAVRSCALNHGSGRLCTIQELTIARSPTTPSSPQQVLNSGYWLGDRLADDQAAITNATTGDNFDASADPLSTASGYYCCTGGNFFR